MKNNSIILAIVMLGVGGCIGYAIAANKYEYPMLQPMACMHRMPDGTMMGNMVVGEDKGMSGMMMDMNAALRGKTGDAFDKAFLEEMIVHHEGAVDMAKLVLSTSKRPELIKLANDIISAQEKEISMMKAWEKAWFAK